jgi:kumamolisin
LNDIALTVLRKTLPFQKPHLEENKMPERKVFQDSVTPLPDQSGLTHNGLMINAMKPDLTQEIMTVLFSLEIPEDAQAQLEEKVARGEVIPVKELQKEYSADPGDVKKLVAWLKGQGYDVKQVTKDGTSVYAEASVGKIEKSLAVNMVRVTKDGVTYTAAQNAPSLPAEVANSVHAIIGLQPFRRAHKHSRRFIPQSGSTDGTKKIAGRRGKSKTSASAAGSQNSPPYFISQILKAYNADGLSVNGKGQTIAILIDTFPVDSDLKAFWKRNKLSTNIGRIKKINVKNGFLPAPEGEETLDAEWASGIAPGANISIYASGSLQFVDLDRALDRILEDVPGQPGMRQLSISLGLGERFMGGPEGEVKTQHKKFLRLAAAGVNVFVSSGDEGSNPDESGHSSTGPTQAEYESSDPAVIGVGGTTLTLALSGKVSKETGWTGGGGGRSMFFPRPVWQKGSGVPVGNERLVPDVSLAADPNTGAFLIFHGEEIQIGGTSWSAPVWAGFCALINEARIKAGKPALPFLNPLIYPLIGTSAFRDIDSGSNGAFSAAAGYDLVTGLGVPHIGNLIKALTK